MRATDREPRNEGKCCDAVARCIEKIYNQSRIEDRPLDTDSAEGMIEYEFRISNMLYGLEHTLLNSFRDKVRKDRHFSNFVEPIIGEIKTTGMPVGHFTVIFEKRLIPLSPLPRDVVFWLDRLVMFA